VSRFAGQFEHVFETTTAGITIQAPQVYNLVITLSFEGKDPSCLQVKHLKFLSLVSEGCNLQILQCYFEVTNTCTTYTVL